MIAWIALIVSTLLLIINYVNQRERRHGELAQLRSDYLTRIGSTQQRITMYTLLAETTRIELRSMVDSEDKYLSIEKMPQVINGSGQLLESIKLLKASLESLDTRKHNKSRVLIGLQAADHDFKSIETGVDALEKSMLDLVAQVRAQRPTQTKSENNDQQRRP
jgi:hypothetical protein